MSKFSMQQRREEKPKEEQEEEDDSWKDTNVGMIGSDLDRSVRKDAANTEKAWQNAGQKPGVEVWRINKFKVECVDVDDYGKFYEGDSYIVLNTYKNKETEAIEYDLFFWIGKDSTQDEYGTAAYKTVELDAYLDDKPVQYREVGRNESQKFLACFSNTFQHLKGGYDSGFNKVSQTVFETKMYKIKGMKNNPNTFSLVEVDMKWSKIYSDSVLLIATNDKVFQLNGPNASHRYKYGMKQVLKSLDVMRCRPQTKVITEEFTSYEDIEDALSKEKCKELFGTETAPEDVDLYRERVKESQEQEEEPEITLSRYNDSEDDWEVLAKGDDIPYLKDIEDNYLWMLDFNSSVVLIDKRKKESKKKSAMVCGQHHLDKKPTKQQRRAGMCCKKNDDEFLECCRSRSVK
ncbi:gelsolin-like protein 2 [Exaiptasia diaphana]|uniref:Gelsolin-like domain-containing protein n=1 Tax=Exaiptasia diaphana TaxID=2652724 RepID=A0A913XRM5_EXADI|nr:gelsolin-like protein 2 [Exaiptasia diaphana]